MVYDVRTMRRALQIRKVFEPDVHNYSYRTSLHVREHTLPSNIEVDSSGVIRMHIRTPVHKRDHGRAVGAGPVHTYYISREELAEKFKDVEPDLKKAARVKLNFKINQEVLYGFRR